MRIIMLTLTLAALAAGYYWLADPPADPCAHVTDTNSKDLCRFAMSGAGL